MLCPLDPKIRYKEVRYTGFLLYICSIENPPIFIKWWVFLNSSNFQTLELLEMPYMY